VLAAHIIVVSNISIIKRCFVPLQVLVAHSPSRFHGVAANARDAIAKTATPKKYLRIIAGLLLSRAAYARSWATRNTPRASGVRILRWNRVQLSRVTTWPRAGAYLLAGYLNVKRIPKLRNLYLYNCENLGGAGERTSRKRFFLPLGSSRRRSSFEPSRRETGFGAGITKTPARISGSFGREESRRRKTQLFMRRLRGRVVVRVCRRASLNGIIEDAGQLWRDASSEMSAVFNLPSLSIETVLTNNWRMILELLLSASLGLSTHDLRHRSGPPGKSSAQPRVAGM